MSRKDKENTDEMLNEELPGEVINENEEEAQPEDETSDRLEEELQIQKDKYLRLAAEFDNFRKRTSKEILDIRQTASRDLITSLLEVLDDMDRAETQINETNEKSHLIDGIQLIFNKFRKTLEQRGLKAIETMYTEFDVEKDEAISEMPVEEAKLKGKVVAELQKGYMLNDKLIRFAKVIVGR